jgi:ethanolamine transporter EutH
MDWISYLTISAVLLGFFAVVLTVRYFLNRRLTNIEKKRQMEEDARQASMSNSGL